MAEWKHYPLYIVVLTDDPAIEAKPSTVKSKADGKIGIAAFRDWNLAQTALAGFEDSAHVAELNKKQFTEMVNFFCEVMGVGHVAIDCRPEAGAKSIWVPREDFPLE